MVNVSCKNHEKEYAELSKLCWNELFDYKKEAIQESNATTSSSLSKEQHYNQKRKTKGHGWMRDCVLIGGVEYSKNRVRNKPA